MVVFEDRAEAGRRLAARMEHLRGLPLVVLGLPRGGVPVAREVARFLAAPLDVLVVRKLGVPAHPELAMGAIGEGGARVLDHDVLGRVGVSEAALAAVERRERAELERRVGRLRAEHARVDLGGRTVVIVDDGMATGSTARVACQVARQLGAGQVVLGVPVAPAETLTAIAATETVICVDAPRRFLSVGSHYRDFSPTTEQEVLDILDDPAVRGPGPRRDT